EPGHRRRSVVLTATVAVVLVALGFVVALTRHSPEAARLAVPEVVAPPLVTAAPTPTAPRTPAPEGDINPDLGGPPGPHPDVAPARTAPPAARFALLVGVQHYHAPTVPTVASVGDVTLIRTKLVAAGWLPENIHVLTDEQATGSAVRDGMAWLASVGTPGTFSFFHYSGHVKQLGGGTEALWPIDRDFVRDNQVSTALQAVTGRLWVDIAGCEAASFLPGLPSDRVLFTGSSKATEKSYEYPEWNASVWTGLLFDQATTRADADADGVVTMGEALRYSRYFAQVVTLTQTPYGRQSPQVEGDLVRGWTLDAPPA
ncbi:MAG: hypothetical protein JWL64_236, partial [Frankiales bacterium]|nr:hypothetical protein [Frankiales bacterium]